MEARIKQVLDVIRQSVQSPYFGFVQGHAYLHAKDVDQIGLLVGRRGDEIVLEFETEFASLVGDGFAVSYAAGRMGFYDLMRVLGINRGDEVILLGATCAVMVNAVIRIGATPIFSDIDPNTFGSEVKSIEACITSNTRMIVAQHSFGIPCNIEPIVDLAKSQNIFLLEDCALTLGSKIVGTTVGNFGDAALFSTDHGKPLNTLTGGLIYSRNTELVRCLRQSQSSCPELPYRKQKALWRRFLLERYCCVPQRYGRMGLIDLFSTGWSKLFGATRPFLSDDFGAKPSATYPYPARMPTFLAALGTIEVKRWPTVASERKELLGKLLEVARITGIAERLPKAYSNSCVEIVPLRFAWFQENGLAVRKSIAHFVRISWTWFMQPIIATRERLETFGYRPGCCPVSERIGFGMVNLPCNISQHDSDELVKLFQEAII